MKRASSKIGSPVPAAFRPAPEIRAAQRLVERLALKPPVDIRALVGKYATIEEDAIPTGADAILLYPSAARKRPLIILDNRKPVTRQTFTLAHELGHILLPWHVGELAYHQDRLKRELAALLYQDAEGEANRFAAEILMPTSWMKGIIGAFQEDFAKLTEQVMTAGVSVHAASWNILTHLPCGFVMAHVDEDGVVKASGKSRGTTAYPAQEGTSLDDYRIGSVVLHQDTVECSDGTFHWWRLRMASRIAASTGVYSAREILEEIISECGLAGSEAKAAYQSISGITGCAASQQDRNDPEKLLAILQQRFASPRGHDQLVDHPRFQEYLATRAVEMTKSRR